MAARSKPPTPTQQASSGAKKKSSAAGGKDSSSERVISENRKARHEYEILETLECGIALVGSEVKSLRSGRISLDEAYGRVDKGEVWLVGCDIPEYEKANQLNHVPKRRRKLLLHRREIAKFAGHAFDKGLTLVPLKMYFSRGRAKLLLGVGRGRKTHDKRQKLKADTAKRDIDTALKSRR
ncbi:MAG: SsrA-binding protein SmpB [Pirellulales bacterium]|nr:SsrA-binding protein SmpB [Pirellulales bacterium]MBL7192530.1 SsrA-binding protein SmpB [Pirellulales bacterium]MDA0817091.1 SsrA-binding protein SmpB [Planctomycetota bacterium]MDA0969951.1 SsrA-binding protein SmpB [Planctomycetota bacterium]